MGFALVILVIIGLVSWYGHLIQKKITSSESLIESQQAQLLSNSKLAALGVLAVELLTKSIIQSQ